MNKHIVVSGDITLDNNFYKGERSTPDISDYGTVVSQKLGGSYLLHLLIRPLLEDINQKYFQDAPVSSQFGFSEQIAKDKKFPPALQTYAIWQQIKDKDNNPTGNWKMRDALGFGTLESASAKRVSVKDPSALYQEYCCQELVNAPDLLVFDDGGSFFGGTEAAWNGLLDAFRKDMKEGDNKSIVLKMTYPVSRSKLLQRLSSDFQDRLAIVISAAEIRREDVLVTQDVSWEQTALDLVQELCCNPVLKPLLRCRHLFINFASEGALYIEMKGDKIWRNRLIFDPAHMEGEWTASNDAGGKVIGLQNCFVAGVAYGFLSRTYKPENGSPDQVREKKDRFVDNTLTGALSAMRLYKSIGHVQKDAVPDFPAQEIGRDIISPKHKYSSAFVPVPSCMRGENDARNLCEISASCRYRKLDWTILEGNYHPQDKPLDTYQLGMRFALQGEEALVYAPHLRIKGLTLYDRKEIEAMRNLKTLIGKYLREDKGKQPLSLAVFGTPGSGKSFAVKELAGYLGMPVLEFNLSQFDDPGDLVGALHQVRDKVLEGKTPCVFWDEFDSQEFKWLQYLLAPMQDGKFQQGEVTHPIGKCVFIFAGATSYSYEKFGVFAEGEDSQTKQKEYAFRLKKGPDFISRLSGYLNIKGINDFREDKAGDKSLQDLMVPVRRAQMIRSILGAKEKEALNIDPGLLNALIRIGEYKKGVRALQQLLKTLKVTDHCRFQRVNTPPAYILEMLVSSYEDFLALVNQDMTVEMLVIKVAPLIHNIWLQNAEDEGWKMEYHKPFNMLPAHIQGDNFAAARRIADVLRKMDLMFVTKSEAGRYAPFSFAEFCASEENLEVMSRLEHDGWCHYKEEVCGWQYSPERNDDRKQHNCLVHWSGSAGSEPLRDEDKAKDRNTVIDYARLLDCAGLAIVRTSGK